MNPCPKCRGSGRLEGSRAAAYRDWFDHPIVVVCPRCRGTGTNPPGRHVVTADRPHDTACGIVIGRVLEHCTLDAVDATCPHCLDAIADGVCRALGASR